MESPIPVSSKLQALIENAKQLHGQPSRAAPVATPARTSAPPPCVECHTPEKAQAEGSKASPMSVQVSPAIPVSPDLKRFRTNDSSDPASELPSLPSFDSSSTSRTRHADTATTLSLTEYFVNMSLNPGLMTVIFRQLNCEAQPFIQSCRKLCSPQENVKTLLGYIRSSACALCLGF